MGGKIMNELYWISVIGKLNTLFWVMFGISVVAGVVLYFLSDYESEHVKLRKHIKLTIISLIVWGLGGIITPGRNEAYVIYGAGVIVDYCKGDSKVKEIPDKAIDALNRYLDSIKENEKYE